MLQFGWVRPSGRPRFRAPDVTDFFIATLESARSEGPSTASHLRRRAGLGRRRAILVTAIVIGNWVGSTIFGDLEDLQSEQFLDPVEPATYGVALTVAYPAIKIIDQSRVSSRK